MIGAIAGDVIGSVYESRPTKTTEFPLLQPGSTFTDDTVLTIAVADAILSGADYATALKQWGLKYRGAGYGGMFIQWLLSPDSEPYNSWGNGSAMRVSPVGFGFATIGEVLSEAERTAEVTHDHPEGIKGAQAVAAAVLLARHGESKAVIKREISRRFSYDLKRTLEDIRPTYRFDVSCQGSVPESIIAFLESEDWEDAVRKAISLGGDSDTMACIAGAIAQAYYREVPGKIVLEVRDRLPEEFLAVIDRFDREYRVS